MSPTLRLRRLALAIATQEGFSTSIESPATAGSRGWRNHNPGNLRNSPFKSGIKDGFAVFADDHWGFMALEWDLLQKATGNSVTGLNGDSTLRDLIYKWAPPSDGNSTEEYLMAICSMTGYRRDMKLSELL